MRRVSLVLLLLAASSAVALAQSPLSDPVVVANLDGDAANESIVVREISCGTPEGTSTPPCDRETTTYRRVQIDLVDACGATDRRTALLPRVEEIVDQLRAVELDGDAARKEVVVTGYSGASGRVGSGAVVRLRDGADGCATVRRLFAFGPARARTHKPKGARDFTVGTLRARSLRGGRDFPGKELQYSEAWYRRGDPGCCPTWSSTISLRFDRAKDRYVTYRSTVRRLRER